METTSAVSVSAPRLRRTLTLWDLILYGIIVIQPTAPMPAYGVFSNAGQGHVVTSILIAMIAMVFTAMSYGRMARVYPSAGSAYTYVGRELHPSLGYVTGWSMTMDYILNPLIHLVCQGHGRSVERNAISDSLPGAVVAVNFCRAVHSAQPTRSTDFSPHQ
jgi:amino acid transporter